VASWKLGTGAQTLKILSLAEALKVELRAVGAPEPPRRPHQASQRTDTVRRARGKRQGRDGKAYACLLHTTLVWNKIHKCHARR
jgi:hypothetical protein